jgi:hypothetical protein
MNRKKTIHGVTTLLCAIAASVTTANAQALINANSVDLYDSQILLVNPGAIKFQDAQIVVGTNVLHYGFLDRSAAGLRNSYVTVTLPDVTKLKLGLGVLGTSFRTPIFSENKLNLMLNIKLGENIAIGTQFGMLTKSFNRDEFVLVDEGDPVFSKGTSKYAFNLGLGTFWQAKQNLQLGLALENVNRPNISLIDDDVYQGRILHFSANYVYSRLEAYGGFILDGNRFFPGIGLSTSLQGIGIMKLGILAGNLDIGTQLHINEQISFDYKFSYPFSPITSFSSGSHRVSLSYRFGTIPAVDFEVFATVDTQRISEKRLYKNVLDSVQQREIVKYDKVYKLMSAKDPVNTYYTFVPVEVTTSLPKIDFDPFIKKYRGTTDFLGKRLQANKNLSIRIVVDKDSEKFIRLAGSFSEYFQEAYRISASKLEYGYAIFDSANVRETNGDYYHNSNKINSPVTHFIIRPIISRKYNRIKGIKSWALAIENSRGEVIRKFQGNNEPPAAISWDWTTRTGAIIEVGKYSYYLEWTDKRNKERRSPKRVLQVARSVREITVDFTKRLKQQKENHLRIDWHLGKSK